MEPDKNPPKESNPLFYFGNFYRENLSFDFIRLTQICEIALEPDGEVNEHTQICHEITLIVSGNGTFYTEDTALSVRQGDIHVVACGDRHRICASSSEKLRYICIGFSFDEEKPPILIDFWRIFSPSRRFSCARAEVNCAALSKC